MVTGTNRAPNICRITPQPELKTMPTLQLDGDGSQVHVAVLEVFRTSLALTKISNEAGLARVC